MSINQKDATTHQHKWKLVLLGLILLLVLNGLLSHVIHVQIHRKGEELVSALSNPDNSTSIGTKQHLLQKFGYTLKPSSGREPHHFQLDDGEMVLYHRPVLLAYGPILLFFNLLFVGLLAFVHRWLFVYREEKSTKLPAVIETQEPLYNVFMLASWQCQTPSNIDPKVQFQLAFAKNMLRPDTFSLKYLPSGSLAITIREVKSGNVGSYLKKVHEIIFQTLVCYRRDLSRSTVKVGACFYLDSQQQVHVYQGAKSALSIAENQVWQHTHLIHLTDTLAERLKADGDALISYLKNGQFSLFFQPLFDLQLEEVIVSEALLRVKHKEMGKISAKQFLQHLYTPEQFQFLDKTIVQQTLAVCKHENSNSKVSINLHITSWLDEEFITWLSSQLCQSGMMCRVGFELNVDEVYQYGSYLTNVFRQVREIGAEIYVDNVSKMLSTDCHQIFSLVTAIKLSYELVHEVDSSSFKRQAIRQIVKQASAMSLPVYAVGVENNSELMCIKALKVQGAQGHYFSAPLQQLADIN
ncbi:EAL domain-containing protein [Pseudoalteromonas sp. T1lg65]|uniref:EAL domain-containing protein n=1 Tax=Pseudoalteromonas sp. T1lg65 TaxID=2077101 RepID=UPI003F7A433A